MVTNDERSARTATKLGFDFENSREQREFQKFQNKMKLVDAKLQKSLRNSWYEAHCTAGKSAFSKSRKKIFQNMDAAEDIQTTVIKQHLDRALEALNLENKPRVLSYLADLKDKTSVTIISAEDMHKDASIGEIKANLAEGCNLQSGEYFSDNGGSDEK